jgi:hypothetical protein
VDTLRILSLIGAVALAALAAPFLVRPRLAEKLGVTALDGNGWLEVRGIYGGLLLALAVVCLAAREPYAFLTAGSPCSASRWSASPRSRWTARESPRPSP